MKLITLTGGSATGKDFILKNVLRMIPSLIPVVSHTTRPMRNGETEGKEYYFIDIATATDMLNNNEFIETRQYNVAVGETWLYGIHKCEIDLESDDTYIAIVDLQGLKKIERYLEENNCRNSLTSIYIDVDYQIRLQRSLQREGKMTNEQVLEVVRRFQDDIQFVDPAKDYCDMTLKNNTLTDLVEIIFIIEKIVNKK